MKPFDSFGKTGNDFVVWLGKNCDRCSEMKECDSYSALLIAFAKETELPGDISRGIGYKKGNQWRCLAFKRREKKGGK